MSMNAMYTNGQLQTAAEQLANIEQERQARLNGDPVVRAAQSKLDRAKSDYEELQSRTRTMPYQQRVNWHNNIKASEQAVSDASRELQMAINSNSSANYVAKLQAEAKEQAKQQKQAEAQRVQELEAKAKAEYRPVYLANGATEAQFLAAWPSIWQKELEARTTEQVAVKRAQLRRGYDL